jgi:Sulfotransferase family
MGERAMTNFVYLMGHGYSGSTLLTFLLNAHPGIATVGEMGIASRSKVRPEEFLCSCGEPIGECPFWQRTSREMGARGFPFDIREPGGGGLLAQHGRPSERLLAADLRPRPAELLRRTAIALWPAARRRRDEILAKNRAFVEVATGIKGCHTFLDSTKRPERALLLAQTPGFATRVLHLVRDGRAVAWSCAKNLGQSVEEGAASWLADARSCERARAWFPADRWLTVRYEDLCADPQDTLARIFRFLGLPPAEVGDFRAAEHHVIGNRMRLQRTSEIRLDERWKAALSARELAVADRVTASYNRRYGYGPFDCPAPALAPAQAVEATRGL